MKEHFSSRVAKLLVILALAIVASVMFVIVGCDGGTEEPPAHTTHTWVADSSRQDVEATCTVDGVHYLICSECGMTTTEIEPATGHTWANNGTLLIENATCTQEGYYYRLCEDCGYRETSSVIPATGHHLEYSADASTIVAPNCTTDGTITGVCKDCGEEFTYTGTQLANGEVTISGIPDSVLNNKEYNLANPGQTAKFLVAPGHDYAYDNEASCVVMEVKRDGTQLWNKCERCEEEFTAVAHTVPTGFAPCQVATGENGAALTVPTTYAGLPAGVQNASTYATVVNGVGEEYAYQCSECENYLKPGDHNYQISRLVSGNPVLDPDNAVFEVAEGVTVLDCHYYYVCTYCNDIEVATPHTYPVSTDTANYRNCGHGDLCTVCGLALSQPTGHTLVGVMDRDHKDVTFGGFTFAEPTCTTDGVAYQFCTGCKAREDAGEEITWTLGTNYQTISGYEKLNHTNWAVLVPEGSETRGFYVATVSRAGDDAAVDCVTGTYNRDICNICGATRIEVRPSLYTTNTNGTLSNPVAADAALTDTTTYYYMENGRVVSKTGAELANAPSGRAWTDANGNYGGTLPGEHTWVMMSLSDYSTAELSQIRYPTCDNETAHMLYQCSVCKMETWRTVSIDDYAAAINTTTEDLIADYKEAGTWHVGTMNACGHDLCSACTYGNHEAQYYFNFQVENNAFNVSRIAYYSCRTDAENLETINAYIATVIKNNQTDGVNAVKFFTDAAHENEVDWNAIVKGSENGSQIFVDKTIYVTRDLLPVDDENQTYFVIDGYVAAWSTTDGDLDIGWSLNNTVIPNTTITSITVTLKDASDATCVEAVSSGTQLAAYLNECRPYWEEGATTLAYSIDGFCTASGTTSAWTYTNTTVPAHGSDLTGYTVTVSIACGANTTYVLTGTVA